jgi:hypothetical protein
MIIEGHDLLEKYRRLRILYNRVGIFGTKIFYSYWFEHVFQTKLGPRKFVCSLPYMDTEDEIMDFYYVDENGHTLFEIQINKNRYNFLQDNGMNEEQAWLAIHELEELSYKELELHETV